MSGFLRTMSALEQNFFACLPVIAKEESKVYPLGGGGDTEKGILLSETAYFLCSTASAGHAQQA